MKDQRGGVGFSVTPRPLYPRKRDLVTIARKARGAPRGGGVFWTGAARSHTQRDSIPPDGPADSQSLYRCYPVPFHKMNCSDFNCFSKHFFFNRATFT